MSRNDILEVLSEQHVQAPVGLDLAFLAFLNKFKLAIEITNIKHPRLEQYLRLKNPLVAKT